MSNTQNCMSLFVQNIHFKKIGKKDTVLSHQEQKSIAKKRFVNTQPREGV